MIPGSKPLRINVCEAKVPTDEAAAAGGAAAVGAVIGADEAHAKRACPRARCSVFVLICMCVSASVSVGAIVLVCKRICVCIAACTKPEPYAMFRVL